MIVHGTDLADILGLFPRPGVFDGADTMFGLGGNDEIWGGDGDDTLKGGGGADDLLGGSGIDTASYDDSTVGVAVDLEWEPPGDSRLEPIVSDHFWPGAGYFGTAAGDRLISIENVYGSQHADLLAGNGDSNTLWGSGGDDTLKGGGGADFLYGGSGIDTASYDESAAGVVVSLITGSGSGGDAEDDELTAIENLTGSDHDDELRGDDADNVLRGQSGDDTLKGGGGADTLWGGWGADLLAGGSGADTMYGGHGNDTYFVDSASDVVTESAGQGTLDRVKTSTTYSLAAGSEVEVLETTKPDGLTAIDLVGNCINNTITGNAGTNVIVGGAGLDTMVGGGGADIFVWNSIAEMGSTVGANSDTVGSDFNAAIGDLIALNPIDADGNSANGDSAFTFIGDASNPFTAAGQVSWFNNGPGTDTYVLLNTDGDATAEGVMRVLGVHAVDAGWFVL
jgi:Ca2+-binding RTX toxin-like protein